jgi:hypothetical protein
LSRRAAARRYEISESVAIQLLQPLIFLLLIADVGADRLLVAPDRIDEESSGPKVLSNEIALSSP